MRYPTLLLLTVISALCRAQELQAFAPAALSELPDGSGFVCRQGNLVCTWKFGRKQPEPFCRLPNGARPGELEASISPDGRFAFFTLERVGEMHDLKTGKTLWSGIELADAGATFSIDGQLVAIQSATTTTIRDLRTGRIRFDPESVGDIVAFSPDSKWVAIARPDGSFGWWDVHSHQPIGQHQTEHWHINAMVFSPDGKHLLTADKGLVEEWDVPTGERAASVETAPNNAYDSAVIGYMPDGRPVATNYRRSLMQVWDVRSGKIICGPLLHSRWTDGAVFAPQSGMLLVNCDGVRAWKLPSGKFEGSYGNPPLYNTVQNSLDGRYSWYSGPNGLLVDSWTGRITRKRLADRYDEHLLSPDLTCMVLLTSDEKQRLIAFINVQTGQKRTFPAPTGFFQIAACADNGSWVLLADQIAFNKINFAVFSGRTGTVVATFAKNVDGSGGVERLVSSHRNLVSISTMEHGPGSIWTHKQEILEMPSGKTLKNADAEWVDVSHKKATRDGMTIDPTSGPMIEIGEMLPLERGWAFWDGKGNYDASSVEDVRNVMLTTMDGKFRRLVTLHRVRGLLARRLKQLHWHS